MLNILYILELLKRLEHKRNDYCDLLLSPDGTSLLIFYNNPRRKAFKTLEDLRDWLEQELAP